MEVLAYWQIIRRRWWIPILLVLLVGLFSALQLRPWQSPPPSYHASMRLLVGVLPATDADLTAYDARFYAWQTSEYLVDDFTEVVSSSLFAPTGESTAGCTGNRCTLLALFAAVRQLVASIAF